MSTTPSILYEAASRTLAVASGPPRPRVPNLPQTYSGKIGKVGEATGVYSFDQDFEMLIAYWPPAQKNAPSTYNPGSVAFAGLTDANAILTKLSQPSPTGGGKGKFTASFARVPASWDDFQTQIVTFPGWLNVIGTNFRDPKPVEVSVRMRYDYFVVDTAGLLTSAGVLDSGGGAIVRVGDKSNIPILRRTPWLATFPSGTVLANCEAKALVPAAGVVGANGTYLPTLPTIEQYRAWCGIATSFYTNMAAGSVQWTATTPPVWDGASSSDVLSGQVRWTNSRLTDYEGNIVQRVTTYVLCE